MSPPPPPLRTRPSAALCVVASEACCSHRGNMRLNVVPAPASPAATAAACCSGAAAASDGARSGEQAGWPRGAAAPAISEPPCACAPGAAAAGAAAPAGGARSEAGRVRALESVDVRMAKADVGRDTSACASACTLGHVNKSTRAVMTLAQPATQAPTCGAVQKRGPLVREHVLRSKTQSASASKCTGTRAQGRRQTPQCSQGGANLAGRAVTEGRPR